MKLLDLITQVPTLYLLGWAVGSFVLLRIAIVVYRLTLHPLANVPGPKLAAATKLWQAYYIRKGEIPAMWLHDQYGPVVRIGPNEVIFNTPEAYHEIYRAGSLYGKAPSYMASKFKFGTLDWFGRRHPVDTLDLFTETEPSRYRFQRRAIGNVYSSSNMKKYVGVVDGCLNRVIASMKALDGKEIDLLEWMHLLSLECLAAPTLSIDMNLRSKGTDGGMMVEGYWGFWRVNSVLGLWESLVYLREYWQPLKKIIPLLFFMREKNTAINLFVPAMMELTSQAAGNEPTNKVPEAGKVNIFQDLREMQAHKPEFTNEYLECMVMTNFGAGHDTLASSLTSVLTRVGQRPDVQARLHEELSQTPKETAEAVAAKRTKKDSRFNDDGYSDGLPYTRAVTREAMRLGPVIAANYPRTVPEGGLNLHGYRVPAGSVVGINAFSLHRNEDIYGPDAAEFEPERWLRDDNEQAQLMDRVSLTWGGASRSCPGQHLAKLIIARAVPALLRTFEIVEVKAPCELEKMPYFFFSSPTGIKVRLRVREN